MSTLSSNWTRFKNAVSAQPLTAISSGLCAVSLLGLGYSMRRFMRMDADYATYNSKLNVDFFRNKIIWITGASSGIGQQLAYYIVSLNVNCKLILTARREDKLNEIKKDISSKYSEYINSDDIYVLSMDLNELDLSYYQNKYSSILKYFNVNKIDILVNNAGFGMRSSFIDFDLKDTLNMINVNFTSYMILTKLVLNDIIKQAENNNQNGINAKDTFGHIVNVSSVAGRIWTPVRSTYNATKCGLIAWTYTLAHELSYYKNININVVVPGFVATDVDLACKGKKGTIYGKKDNAIKTGMKVSRCVELMCIAMSNNIIESWPAMGAARTGTYLSYYIPDTFEKHMRPKLAQIRRKEGYIK